MARRWRVGILGLGHWYSANNLARALREHPKAELVAVACLDADKLAAFASTFGVEPCSSYAELLARDDIDVVQISPPVPDIQECAIGAARAGKPMILGKPMAPTIAQAAEIVRVVKESGVRCMPFEGYMRLAGVGLKRRLDAGEIGEIAVMHMTGRWSIAEDWYRSGKPGWFADPTQVPGGAFIDEGIYSIDRMLWFAGSPVVKVEAKTANLVHKDIGVEDWGFATYTFANGIIATSEASWTICSPKKTGPSPKQNAVNRVEIIGTRGEIISDSLLGPGLAILGAGAAGWVIERSAPEFAAPPAIGPLGHLIECLETGAEPVASVDTAYAAFVAGMAAYESARTGRPVEIKG